MITAIRNNGICGILAQCVVAAGFLAVAHQVGGPAMATLGAIGLLFIKSMGSSTNNLQKQKVVDLTLGASNGDVAPAIPASPPQGSFEISRSGNTNMAIWQPKTKEEMTKVINELDTQPMGRACYQHAAQLVNTTSPFLLTDTSASAMAHRKEIVKPLKADRFIAEWGRNNSHQIPMKMIAKGWLGIELTSNQCETLRKLNSDFHDGIQDQGKYQQFVEDLLEEQIEKIKTQGSSASSDGLLVQEIVKKLQTNPNQNDLHKDPDLKSIILLLLAVKNLDAVMLIISLKVVMLDDEEIKSLKDEINQSGVIRPDGSLEVSILRNATQMPHLDQLYNYCLNAALSSKTVVTRYVENEMECGDYIVPPNTLLLVKSPSDGPEVFSLGKRSCPGRFVAESIAKALTINLIESKSDMKRPKFKYKDD